MKWISIHQSDTRALTEARCDTAGRLRLAGGAVSTAAGSCLVDPIRRQAIQMKATIKARGGLRHKKSPRRLSKEKAANDDVFLQVHKHQVR